MNKLIFFFLLFILLAPRTVLSEPEKQIITLKDGSQIKGELIGVGNGEYSIQTQAMGAIKIKVSQVSSIANEPTILLQPAPGGTSSSGSGDGFNQQIQATQSKLMNDPHLMNDIQGLMQDPDLMKLLTDPVLVKKVMAHDVAAIEKDPKAQELMRHPKMLELMKKMQNSNSSK